MAKYGAAAQKQVKKELHGFKHKGKFQSKQQAVAVGLAEARKRGAKAPKPPTGGAGKSK